MLKCMKPNEVLLNNDVLEVKNRYGRSVGRLYVKEKRQSYFVFSESSEQAENLDICGLTLREVRDYFEITYGFRNPFFNTSFYSVRKQMKNKVEKKEEKKKYILWCPTSHLPPRVILEGIEKAREVAKSMATRHGTEFNICELKESFKVKQKVVKTLELSVTKY